ncbi:hypothetical protein ELH81_15715 [Rhizobium leguminosarum]|nr:hypothetical protein ELH81_15715 [Rhizobium leguminosarum]
MSPSDRKAAFEINTRAFVTLGDRLRLLSALDGHGTLTAAESLTAFSETKPIAGLRVTPIPRFDPQNPRKR